MDYFCFDCYSFISIEEILNKNECETHDTLLNSTIVEEFSEVGIECENNVDSLKEMLSEYNVILDDNAEIIRIEEEFNVIEEPLEEQQFIFINNTMYMLHDKSKEEYINVLGVIYYYNALIKKYFKINPCNDDIEGSEINDDPYEFVISSYGEIIYKDEHVELIYNKKNDKIYRNVIDTSKCNNNILYDKEVKHLMRFRYNGTMQFDAYTIVENNLLTFKRKNGMLCVVNTGCTHKIHTLSKWVLVMKNYIIMETGEIYKSIDITKELKEY